MSSDTGRVIKAVGGTFAVDTGSNVYNCLVRGNVKRDYDILVGDYVEISNQEGAWIIEKINSRKNCLIRPPVANIDCVMIVISPVPKPDFTLIDKLIINCNKQQIQVILCYNKIDIIDDNIINSVKEMYDDIVTTHYVSAQSKEGIDDLRQLLTDKFICLAGQSAVGKSSIINALSNDVNLKIGELSRNSRGKHTTRHIEILSLDNNSKIADTCGFSSLSNLSMPPEELHLYYNEYLSYSLKCRYNGCCHYNEPDCEVKLAVEQGILNRDRYERYRTIYNELKDNWSKRYE